MNVYKLHFIPLGGIVGVTKNMYVYELYVKTQMLNVKTNIRQNNNEEYKLQDILIVDCGIGFPKEKKSEDELTIPDITYLKGKESLIRGIVLTHGHEDHISALPYLYLSLRKPKIFASQLTTAFLASKFKELKIKPDFNQESGKMKVSYDKEYLFGGFKVKFVRLTHSIPDTTHIIIKTPAGTIYHGSDFKFDLTPPYGAVPDFYEIAKAGKEGILCLLSDCLGSEEDGLTLSESIVGQTFEDEMRKTKGKFIMTTFSSNISRIRQCVEAAVKFNRKIFFLGRSMKENTEIAKKIGYLPIPPSFIGEEKEIFRLSPNKICMIVAGSQGQENSALSKLAAKQNPNAKIESGDKVVFSSDPIPGNEDEVYDLIEKLIIQGADVVYSDIHEELHASGHGNREDLKLLIRLINPKYFIPIGGMIRHQRQYQIIVENLGFRKESVIMLSEGETVSMENNILKHGEKIKTKDILIKSNE